MRQTTLPGFALAALGLGAMARGGLVAAALAGSGVVAMLGNSVVLSLLLSFDFDPFWLAVFRPYPLICYGVAALWAGVGLQWLIDHLSGWTAARWPARTPGFSGAPWATWSPAAVAVLVGAAMVAVSASASWPANDRSDSDFAERHAEAVFDLLPQDAVLFVYGDAIGPLGYYRFVDERRPDVDLYSLQGLVFGNRLFDHLLPEEEKTSALDRFVDAAGRPVFLPPDYDIFPHDRGYGHRGFVLEVLGEGSGGTIHLTRDPRAERYFLDLLDRQPTDRWERARRNALLSHYGAYLGLVFLLGDPVLLEPAEPLFRGAEDCYSCLTGLVAALLDNWNEGVAAHADRIAAWLTRAETQRDQALSKGESADLPFLQGVLAEFDRRRSHRRRPLPAVLRPLSASPKPGRRRPPPPRSRAVTSAIFGRSAVSEAPGTGTSPPTAAA